MTTTQTVRRTKLNAELEAAGKAGDISRMQSLIFQDMRLLQSVYGTARIAPWPNSPIANDRTGSVGSGQSKAWRFGKPGRRLDL
jgi:hypothetical protein